MKYNIEFEIDGVIKSVIQSLESKSEVEVIKVLQDLSLGYVSSCL